MKERTIKRHKFLIRKKHRNFRGLFGEKKEHRKDSKWLRSFKRDFEYKEEQEELGITPEKIEKILRKMPN